MFKIHENYRSFYTLKPLIKNDGEGTLHRLMTVTDIDRLEIDDIHAEHDNVIWSYVGGISILPLDLGINNQIEIEIDTEIIGSSGPAYYRVREIHENLWAIQAWQKEQMELGNYIPPDMRIFGTRWGEIKDNKTNFKIYPNASMTYSFFELVVYVTDENATYNQAVDNLTKWYEKEIMPIHIVNHLTDDSDPEIERYMQPLFIPV